MNGVSIPAADFATARKVSTYGASLSTKGIYHVENHTLWFFEGEKQKNRHRGRFLCADWIRGPFSSTFVVQVQPRKHKQWLYFYPKGDNSLLLCSKKLELFRLTHRLQM